MYFAQYADRDLERELDAVVRVDEEAVLRGVRHTNDYCCDDDSTFTIQIHNISEQFVKGVRVVAHGIVRALLLIDSRLPVGAVSLPHS